MPSDNENAIAKKEHDPTYGTKKVTMYGDDGNGNLTRVFANGLQIGKYDYVSMTLSGGNTIETYTFKTGGSGGTTVATITIVYTDSTRANISTVTKT